MRISYGVVWREAGAAFDGRLELAARALELHPAREGEPAPAPLAFDDLVGVEIRPPEERPALVLRSKDDREVVLESAVDRWILGDLVARLFVHGLGGGPARRTLVALRLRPGCRERARELLRAGPPFDPGPTDLSLHEAFLLEDTVLFLFATRGGEELEALTEPDFWRPAAAWRELMSGEILLAEPAFAWRRDEAGRSTAHLGLGL